MYNMRNFDAWKELREKTVIEGGLKVLRNETYKGLPAVCIWRPKAKKPFANYRFNTLERREEFIKAKIDGYKMDMERKEKLKQDRKGTPELLKQADPGAIFHYSGGYEQTNCDFYQVIERKGQFVIIREIAQKAVEGSQVSHGMAENRVAVKDSFLERSKPMRKKVQFSGESPYITMASYGWCSLWNGEPEYCSWYA